LLSKQQHVKEKLALGSWDFRPVYGLIENHSDVAAGKVICEMGSAEVPIAPCTGPGCGHMCVLLKVCERNSPLIGKNRKCKHEIKKRCKPTAHYICLREVCVSCACMQWPACLFAYVVLCTQCMRTWKGCVHTRIGLNPCTAALY